MAYNPYSEVVESLWNDYPDAQDEAVSRARTKAAAFDAVYLDTSEMASDGAS